MIMEGLRVLLLGMAGMFMVMGIIIAATQLLNKIGKEDKKEEP
jgi:Na+-transporting methylmalonyl-CoA/oxaloacetate decarboxylase gamma subunit